MTSSANPSPITFYAPFILLFLSLYLCCHHAYQPPNSLLVSFSISSSPLFLYRLPPSALICPGYNIKRSDVTLIDSYLEDIPQGIKERVESNALPIDFPADLIAPKLFICHSKC